MKKTLSILAVAALSLGATTSYAKEIVLRPYGNPDSPTVAEVIAAGATLINTETGEVVVYDTEDVPPVDPPFDIAQGQRYWKLNLSNKYNEAISLEDVSKTATDSAIRIADGDTLVLDFKNGPLGWSGPSMTEAEYMVLMFREIDAFGDDFAEWYSTNELTIIGRFKDADYLGYVIDGACDMLTFDPEIPDSWVLNPASTQGGLVFFSEKVIENVLNAEVSVPEPTTATLSLLALAGLVARRRRK